MSSDEVNGDLSQQGKIADGGAVANPTVILSEGDVEHPVQAVFDGPVLANAFWQPIASKVTMLPLRSSVSSSSGTAVISFDLSPTWRWPSTSPRSLAQALTICSGP